MLLIFLGFAKDFDLSSICMDEYNLLLYFELENYWYVLNDLLELTISWWLLIIDQIHQFFVGITMKIWSG